MTQLHWPIIHRHPPQDAHNHAASLEADFEALDAAVKLSSSKHHRLPSSLRDDIVRGISKAFSDDEYPYELSKEDEKLIGALMLKHITIEAAERARDRIPLRLYHDLRKSFQELVPKLSLDDSLPGPNSLTKMNEGGANNFVEPGPVEPFRDHIRDSVSRIGEAPQLVARSNGHDTHEGAGQGVFNRNNQVSPEIGEVTIRPKKKGRKRKKRDGLQTKEDDKASAAGDLHGNSEIMGTQHGVEETGVHKDDAHSQVEADDLDNHEDLLRMFKDTEAQCQNIRLQVQDFENGQMEESTLLDAEDELIENPSVMGTHVVTENSADMELVEGDTLVNDTSDQAQLPYDKVAKQTRGDPNEHIQHAQKVAEQLNGLDASSIITFNIEHQAAVNRLYFMGPVGILHNVSSSLETMRSLGHDAPHTIRFTNAVLLKDGNVEVHAYAASKNDMQRLSRIEGWDLEFEKSISVPAKSYAVETSQFNVASFNLKTRKHKAAAIKELLEDNLRLAGSLRSVDDIRDIRWCAQRKEESSLIIELRTAQQANDILDIGLFVRGKLYNCEVPRQKVPRCGRCQTIGHHQKSCSSTLRCGNCASQHATWLCNSNLRHCANCHGPHRTSDEACPAMKAYRQRFRYFVRSSPRENLKQQELALETQNQTANLRLSSSNPMPVAPHNEPQIKVEANESLSNLGSVQQHHQGGAAVPAHPSMPVNARNESHVGPRGSEPTQEMDLARNDPLGTPDLISLRRELEDLRMLLGQLSGPQHQPQRRKRGANQMLTSEPSSHARKKPKRGT